MLRFFYSCNNQQYLVAVVFFFFDSTVNQNKIEKLKMLIKKILQFCLINY